MFNTHRISSASTSSYAIRFIAILVLTMACIFALSGCSHEVEVATPPADDEQEETTETNEADETSEDEEATANEEDSTDENSDTEATEEEAAQEEESTHEGPYVISILNAGGQDGLAAVAQETLADNGIENGDDYEITTDGYTGGTITNTTVYVTGEGDDADAVEAEAENIAELLGGTVETFDSANLTDVTMDDIDILVLVGTNIAA